MTTKADILQLLKTHKPSLKEDFGVKEIGLFGSFSNDSATAASDIDLLVEFETPPGWKYLSLEIHLERILGRKVDLVTKNGLKSQIRNKILSTVNYI